MKIKCGRKEYEVSSKDYILDNGACYQIITQHVSILDHSRPKIAKAKFKKLLKDGLIVKSSRKYSSEYCEGYTLYRFVDQAIKIKEIGE